MGGTIFMGEALSDAVKRSKVPETVVDDKVARLLRVMFKMGIFDDEWRPRANAEELYRRPKPAGEFAVSMYDLPANFDNAPLDAPAHRALARRAAREGIVLLKNEGDILPLDRNSVKSIAVIGPNAAWQNRGGGGSSEVQPSYIVTPFEGIMKVVPDSVDVLYERGSTFDRRYYLPQVKPEYLLPPKGSTATVGLRGEYFDNPNLDGKPTVDRVDNQVFFHWGPNPPAEGMPSKDWSVRWTGRLSAPEPGPYKLYLFHHGAFYSSEQGDGARLYVDNDLVIDNWVPQSSRVPSAVVNLSDQNPREIRLEYHSAGEGKQPIMILAWEPYIDDPIVRAAKLAADTDVAILCLGDNQYYCGENNDRGDLRLPGDQEALIRAVRRANSNVIVVLYNGGPILMEDWIDSVPAVLECWYPNQEGGAAIAELLFGDFCPSGKSPVTFGKLREDYSDNGYYPGSDVAVEYNEGLFVGYRHFDARDIDPRFAFGHGLSYTSFAYEDLRITETTTDDAVEFSVECRVINTGNRPGKEVVQLYLSDDESTLSRPEKELKGFKKVRLLPGESTSVEFRITEEHLSYFDDLNRTWIAEPGRFVVHIGSSSRDLRLHGEIVLQR